MSYRFAITSMLVDDDAYYTFNPSVLVNPGDTIWPNLDGSLIVTVNGGWPRHHQGAWTKAPADVDNPATEADGHVRWMLFEEAVRGFLVEQLVSLGQADEWTDEIVTIAREHLP